MLALACSHLHLGSKPPSSLRCDRDLCLHVGVNVTVIGKRSRSGEGERKGLVLGKITRRTEDSRGIAGHRMWSIRGIQPLHLRTRFDRECCRREGVHPIILNDLHHRNCRV